MGLNKNFPKSPFNIINPDVRWFPGDESLGDKGREKLLAPLVTKIRQEVFEWRKKNPAAPTQLPPSPAQRAPKRWNTLSPARGH